MVKIEINNEIYILDVEKAVTLGLLKKANTFPKSWEEFCEKHSVKKGECAIDLASRIEKYERSRYRFPTQDKNLLPDKRTAEAMLALCQLIQLRDCYNDGWKPDWTDVKESKFAIVNSNEKIIPVEYFSNNHILAFKTKELRGEFLNNFKDLIEIAKPLL